MPALELWRLLKQRGKAKVVYNLLADEIEDEEILRIRAPNNILEAQPRNRPGVSTEIRQLRLEEARPLHAKCLWLNNNSWVAYMIGSSNFTSPGFGVGQNPNLEANLVYLARYASNPSTFKALNKSFPASDKIRDNLQLKWDPLEGGEDEPTSNGVLLPAAFARAVYSVDKRQNRQIQLRFVGDPPSGWQILEENSASPFYVEESWVGNGSPETVSLSWVSIKPPSGFLVRWSNSGGEAWWPVNIVSSIDLPPPEELKDLPLEVLIDILTFAGPLHQALKGWLRRKAASKGDKYEALIDPHKRVDTSAFLLQRTRRISQALAALRDRLERPITTESTLHWRLSGPVGVRALVDAILKEGRSEEEKAFLLTELGLELSRIKPKEVSGGVPRATIRQEIRTIIDEMKKEVAGKTVGEIPNLQAYVEEAFQEALK
jgi:hypothetical protein